MTYSAKRSGASKRKSDDRSASPPAAEPEAKRVRADPDIDSDAELGNSSGKGSYKEEPYNYIPPDDEELQSFMCVHSPVPHFRLFPS
jgi:hypothetical protein